MLRPNILLLLLDDVRDDVIPLPSLRALARRGTSFTNAHAAGTSCGLSALLLGRPRARQEWLGRLHE